MAQITVTATRTIEQTLTAEVKVRISDVKEWMRDEYGAPSEHGMEWNDPSVLAEYLQENNQLVYDADGDIDDSQDDWEVQLAEEV